MLFIYMYYIPYYIGNIIEPYFYSLVEPNISYT